MSGGGGASLGDRLLDFSIAEAGEIRARPLANFQEPRAPDFAPLPPPTRATDNDFLRVRGTIPFALRSTSGGPPV